LFGREVRRGPHLPASQTETHVDSVLTHFDSGLASAKYSHGISFQWFIREHVDKKKRNAIIVGWLVHACR
jgi:hypothetical protein